MLDMFCDFLNGGESAWRARFFHSCGRWPQERKACGMPLLFLYVLAKDEAHFAHGSNLVGTGAAAAKG